MMNTTKRFYFKNILIPIGLILFGLLLFIALWQWEVAVSVTAPTPGYACDPTGHHGCNSLGVPPTFNEPVWTKETMEAKTAKAQTPSIITIKPTNGNK